MARLIRPNPKGRAKKIVKVPETGLPQTPAAGTLWMLISRYPFMVTGGDDFPHSRICPARGRLSGE